MSGAFVTEPNKCTGRLRRAVICSVGHREERTMKISSTFDLIDCKDAKLAIITSIYQSMISIAQELRQTVERITIWGSGLILVLDGWLVAGKTNVDSRGKVAISIGIAVKGVGPS